MAAAAGRARARLAALGLRSGQPDSAGAIRLGGKQRKGGARGGGGEGKKQFRGFTFYTQGFHRTVILSCWKQGKYSLPQGAFFRPISIDTFEALLHSEDGSKRFTEQRAEENVASPER